MSGLCVITIEIITSKKWVVDAIPPSRGLGRHGSTILVDRRNAIAVEICPAPAESDGVDMDDPKPQGHQLSADSLSRSIAVIADLKMLQQIIGVGVCYFLSAVCSQVVSRLILW